MADGYTNRELESLLADLESDQVERKECLKGDSPRRIREAVCGFANDLPDRRRPGVVFVGVTDAGHPSGLIISDELLLQLADIKTDGNIVPPPSMTVAKHVLSDIPVAVVTVFPTDAPPVRYRGRTWVRVGPRRAVATAQDERILAEKRRYRDPHFDARPIPDASLADLRVGLFQDEYLPAAVDPETLAANDRTLEERLAAAKMIASADEPMPTVAGILALGKRPQDHLPSAYVQFLRVAGTEWRRARRNPLRRADHRPVPASGRQARRPQSNRRRLQVERQGDAQFELPFPRPAAARAERDHAPQLRGHQRPRRHLPELALCPYAPGPDISP